MPKVEAPVALIHNGAEMVLRVYLDRANAEIERITAQRDAMASRMLFELGERHGYPSADRMMATDFGLEVTAINGVKEIDHG